MPRQIVFIMTDTQRADMLGLANKGLSTPNLDAFAASGTRFERAYTCCPVCGPARSALFTGVSPQANGSWSNCMPLGQTVPTIGQRLASAGFKAAYIGKWHLDGGDYFGYAKCPPGWDPEFWYDMRTYLEEFPEEFRRKSRDAANVGQPWLKAEDTYAGRCSERGVRFLEQNAGNDFLLVVSYDEPHGPFLCPEPYASMYKDFAFPKSPNVRDNLSDKPEHHRVWAGRSLGGDKDAMEIRAPAYFGCNSFVDSEIGKVLAAIDRLTPDALVIYTSDHGDMLGSHSLWNKGPAMYEEITKIPFIARWPGHLGQGTTCATPVSHIDVVPTILAAAGLPLHPNLEGESLSQITETDPASRRTVFIGFNRYEVDHDGFGGFQPIRAACDGRYKLAINLLTSDEFYDLETDPHELRNAIGDPQYAEHRRRLHDAILSWMDQTRDPFRGYYWENRPWRTDAPAPTWEHHGMTRQRHAEHGEPEQLDYDTGLTITEHTRRK